MEVTASLRSRGVFMSGERLRCDVAFVNTSPQGRQDLQSPGSVAGQTLAWASVQIQCLYQWTGGPGAGGGGPAKPDQIPGTSSTSLQTSGSGRLKPKGSLVEVRRLHFAINDPAALQIFYKFNDDKKLNLKN